MKFSLGETNSMQPTKNIRETYILKQQIKSLEEEKMKLQEQLQSAQACKYSSRTW